MDVVGVVSLTYSHPSGGTFPVGTTVVTATAADAAGHQASVDFAITVLPGSLDRKAPLLRLTSPTARAKTVPAVFDLAGQVHDNFGIASLTVKVNGAVQTLDAPLGTGAAIWLDWSVAGVVAENGPNLIEVEAVDLAGRRVRLARSVTFLHSRPALAGVYDAWLEPAGAPAQETTGLVSVSATATGAFSGRVTLGARPFAVRGVLRNDGTARFLPALGGNHEFRIGKGASLRSLGFVSLEIGETDGLSGRLATESLGPHEAATFAAPLAPYHKRNLVQAAMLNQPITGTAVRGVHNLAFFGKAQVPPVVAAAQPQGRGYATLKLANTGTVSLAGYLADGSKYSAASRLRRDHSLALHTILYGKGGSFGGELALADLPDSDVTGFDLLWLRPAAVPKARQYLAGWPQGLRIDAVGTRYAIPASLDFGQGSVDPALGNAALGFTEGLLGAPLSHPVSLDPITGRALRVPPSLPDLTLGFGVASGVFQGKFRHTDGTFTVYRGILLNKGIHRGGWGHFISTGLNGESGSVSLAPVAADP